MLKMLLQYGSVTTKQAGVVEDAQLRAGHYQALVEAAAVEVETEVAHEAVENRHDDQMKVKINSEVKILKLLFSEADVIEPCLSRLLAYDISADDLLNTDIWTDAAPESSIPDVCPTDAVDSVAAQESSIDLVETTIDPYQMKVKELKDWLRKKNLPTLGSKSLLIERVREAMKAGKRRVSFTFVSDDVTESISDVEKNKPRHVGCGCR